MVVAMARSTQDWTPDPAMLGDQVALIAGGAGGIGEATTRLLAAAGAAVVIADKEREPAEKLAAEISADGGRAHALAVDLMDEGECGAMVADAVAAFGGIDILANVAGGMKKHAPWAHLRDWTTEHWDAIFDLNLRYVFWTCRAAIPALEARGGGAIVNIASLNGTIGNPNQSAYGAAKAGLINLTQTLAGECGALGIRVNAVAPGMTLTEAAARTVAADTQTRLSAATPLQRLGRPDDIARAVLFFASPMAEYVTGQLLLVEGGISVNYPYFAGGRHEF
jgi:NAD(P)-dependent dehydrogenase (short-subunit alcohol dehydrogenase family)